MFLSEITQTSRYKANICTHWDVSCGDGREWCNPPSKGEQHQVPNTAMTITPFATDDSNNNEHTSNVNDLVLCRHYGLIITLIMYDGGGKIGCYGRGKKKKNKEDEQKNKSKKITE